MFGQYQSSFSKGNQEQGSVCFKHGSCLVPLQFPAKGASSVVSVFALCCFLCCLIMCASTWLGRGRCWHLSQLLSALLLVHCLSLNLDLINLAILPGEQALYIILSLPFLYQDCRCTLVCPVFVLCARDSTDPHACAAITLLMSHLLSRLALIARQSPQFSRLVLDSDLLASANQVL